MIEVLIFIVTHAAAVIFGMLLYAAAFHGVCYFGEVGFEEDGAYLTLDANAKKMIERRNTYALVRINYDNEEEK